MSKTKKLSFEDALKRLEEISELLEGQEISLEESINLYEEGIKLAKECYKMLNEAELKVTALKKTLDDEFKQEEN